MPPAIKNALTKIGLSDKEVSIVVVLLQHGPMLAAQVAKQAKLNRTTTYGLLKELAGKGLVSSVNKQGAATRYQSIAPEMLPGYIERKRDELAQSKKELEAVVEQVALLRAKGKALPRVQYFEGQRGVEQAYMDLIEHNTQKHIYAFMGLEGVVKNLDPKFVDYFISTRMKDGIDAYCVVPKTDTGHQASQDDLDKMRYTRYIPAQYDFNGEVNIYDNRVAIFSYAKESPVGIIIEDETIAHILKQIFDYAYSTASEK